MILSIQPCLEASLFLSNQHTTHPEEAGMRRSEEAKRWFSEAEWDLESARILHESRRYNSCAFLCQQAAEKCVKGLLYSIGESPFGHSVLELLQRFAQARGSDISELRSLAAELDRHYIPARYPNAMPSGSPHENYDQEVSQRTLDNAGRILDYARRQLA
jgi:HEPN domain-containing protein